MDIKKLTEKTLKDLAKKYPEDEELLKDAIKDMKDKEETEKEIEKIDSNTKDMDERIKARRKAIGKLKK